MNRRSLQTPFALGALVWAFLLTGCPTTGVVCLPGTARCGQGCADFTSDIRNCGACGVACSEAQICENSSCVCRSGKPLCGGACVVTDNDPNNCGGCGNVCTSDQVCEGGECKSALVIGTSALVCGDSCGDFNTDAQNCGGRSIACNENRTCRDGRCTYDAVIACSASGQIRGLVAAGLDAGSVIFGPLTPVGFTPGPLSSVGNLLLVADGKGHVLRGLDLSSFSASGNSPSLGDTPNQVVPISLSGQTFVLVPNAGTGSLQALEVTYAIDGGALLADTTAGEFSFGLNTFPEAVAELNGQAFVPLFGGVGAAGALTGQRLVRLQLSSIDGGLSMSDAGSFDLTALDLHPLGDAGSPIPRPFAIAALGGKIYALLKNLNDSYQPAGPGFLAQLDPSTGDLVAMDLGVTQCLNPAWLSALSDGLLVSCRGRVTYDSSSNVVAVEGAGVERLTLVGNTLNITSVFAAACSTSTGCAPALLGRMAVRGDRVYVAEEGGGRLLVLRLGSDGSLSELRGLSLSVDPACPTPSGYAGFSDVTAIP